MHGCLLVAHQNVLDGVLLVERVVDVQNRAAGVAPDVLDAFGLQCLDQHFSAHEFLRWVAGARGRGCCGDDLRLRDFHDQPLCFFGNEKPWVPLANPCEVAPGLEAMAMSGLMFRRTLTRLPFDLQRGL
jgi:hypothetical protein